MWYLVYNSEDIKKIEIDISLHLFSSPRLCELSFPTFILIKIKIENEIDVPSWLIHNKYTHPHMQEIIKNKSSQKGCFQ